MYRYFRWLSLDIVLGAIFFLSYLGKYYHLSIELSIYFALASAIWLIYTADHLIDAWKVQNPSNERHRFHQRHFKLLVFVAGIVLMLALINIYYLPDQITRAGAVLTACCVVYLMLVYFFKRLWVKEILVAAVYALGIFLAPVTLTTSASVMDVLLIVQLTLIAFLNLMIFSYYDSERDFRDGFNSLVLRLGRRGSSLLIHGVALVSIVWSLVMVKVDGSDIQVLYLSMALLLYSLHLLPKVYAYEDRFRVVGDGAFYLPGIFLLLYL